MEMIFNSNPVEGEFHYVDANKKYQYRSGAWVVYTNNQPAAEPSAIPVAKPLVAATAPAFPQSNPFWQHALTGVLYFQKVVDGVTAWDKVSTDSPPSGTLNADITGVAAYANRFYTPRLINGIEFDGTSDIVINAADSTARIAVTEKGIANGVASLDSAGKVPSAQLPSYVDDVVEVADEASLPLVGEAGKIYVTLANNSVHRWSGSTYIQIPGGVGLADAALKLKTARTIAVSGAVAGSASFDGTANITITTTATVASTGTAGVVQLSNATDSTSETLAATASSVKAAYDLAAQAKVLAEQTANDFIEPFLLMGV